MIQLVPAIVIGPDGFKIEFVNVNVIQNEDGTVTNDVFYFEMQDDWELIFGDMDDPLTSPATANNMIRPWWDGEKWVEKATDQEIEDAKPPVAPDPDETTEGMVNPQWDFENEIWVDMATPQEIKVYHLEGDVETIGAIADIPIASTLNQAEQMVLKTHRWLRKQLSPGMVWKDGNRYNITIQKQSFLAAQIQIGQIKAMSGVDPDEIVVQWNAMGQPHVDWPFTQLLALAMDIHEYVEPLIVKQQHGEADLIRLFTQLANEPENAEQILAEIAEIMKGFE